MWIQAILTRDDLAAVLHELTPLRVTLGEDVAGRALFLGRPQRVELVPGQGLRVTCRARVAWRLAGVRLPVKIHRVTAILVPRIERRAPTPGAPVRDMLAFAVRIEKVDVAALPGFVDAKVADVVNETLGRAAHDLVWDFIDTLSFHFALPVALASAERFDLLASWGEVRVTDDAVVLAVAFHAAIPRRLR